MSNPSSHLPIFQSKRRLLHLLGLAVHTGLTGLVLLVTLLGGILHGPLALDNLLDGGVDLCPVLEDIEGDIVTGAVGDEIWM